MANKIVRVVAAIITDEDRIFATQRGYGDWKGYWEFPGGKIEPGEGPEEALFREIKEELETEIVVQDKLCTIEYDYPNFHLSMSCYFSRVRSGDLILKEHDDSKWLKIEELDDVEWLPADKKVIEKIKEQGIVC